MPSRRSTPTAPISSASSCASAFSSTCLDRSTHTTILGEPVSLPLALAPIGLCGMQHGDGEILACRAAQEAGIPFCLSTMSICSIEDVAAAVDKPFWFQLYVMKDRGFVRALIERAAAAKCSALVLTVDLQVLGQRHRDIKNGMTVPPRAAHQEPHRHRQQAGLGARHRCAASARPSAISPAISAAWRTSIRCRTGSPASSMRR